MVAAKSPTRGRARVAGCQVVEHRPELVGPDGGPILDEHGEPERLGLDTPCLRWVNVGQNGRGTYRPPLARRARAAVMHSMRHVILVALVLVAFLAVTHVVLPKIHGYSAGSGGIFHNSHPSPSSVPSPVPTGSAKP